jgi:hypothetical protein
MTEWDFVYSFRRQAQLLELNFVPRFGMAPPPGRWRHVPNNPCLSASTFLPLCGLLPSLVPRCRRSNGVNMASTRVMPFRLHRLGECLAFFRSPPREFSLPMTTTPNNGSPLSPPPPPDSERKYRKRMLADRLRRSRFPNHFNASGGRNVRLRHRVESRTQTPDLERVGTMNERRTAREDFPK